VLEDDVALIRLISTRVLVLIIEQEPKIAAINSDRRADILSSYVLLLLAGSSYNQSNQIMEKAVQ
jgi:hypothetical protein